MCLIDALTAFRACELPGEPVSTVLDQIICDIMAVDSGIAHAADVVLNGGTVDAAMVKPVDDLRARLSAVSVDAVDEVVFEQTGAYLAALAHVLADLPHAA